MDKYFPSYHFRPEKNWMNDPNGLIYRDGWYHLFFQHNPGGDMWGDIHWGHARSRDLLHWEMRPIALSPDYARGELHCYSGCCVERDGAVYAFYTSVGEGERAPETGAEQWCAVSTDAELGFFSRAGMPQLTKELNAPLDVTMWRDPFIWQEAGRYYMLLGGTLAGAENGVREPREVKADDEGGMCAAASGGDLVKKGVILLYASDDLLKWERMSVFYVSEKYPLIECPVLIKFEERYLLLYSPLEAVRYAVGRIDWKTGRFQAEREGIFDYSIGKKGFYAPNVYRDLPDRRAIVFGCLFEGDRLNAKGKRGWAGMQSLPRCVELAEGRPAVWPAEECRRLRRKKLAALCGTHGGALCASGRAVEIYLHFAADSSGVVRLLLLSNLTGMPDIREMSASPGIADLRPSLDMVENTNIRQSSSTVENANARQLSSTVENANVRRLSSTVENANARRSFRTAENTNTRQLSSTAESANTQQPSALLTVQGIRTLEYTELRIDLTAGRLELDRLHSTLLPDIGTETITADIEDCADDIEVDIFIDHSAIEIFYNRRATLSARVFPSLDASVRHSASFPKTVSVIEAAAYELSL